MQVPDPPSPEFDLNQGSDDGHNALFQALYQELHRLARIHGRNSGETLRPTALLNEAYLKIMGSHTVFENQQKFFAYVALAMRQIVINSAEKARAKKRGGDAQKQPYQEGDALTTAGAKFSNLYEALKQLEEIKPRLAQVISLHYFAGFKNKMIAEILGVSESTINRELSLAKKWLRLQLGMRDKAMG